MTRYLAVFTGTEAARKASGWDELSDEQRQRREAEGISAWRDWMATHEASVAVGGGPLGATKRVSNQGVADTTNNLVGYVVIEADSHAAAAGLFENHPHFSIFPGEAVEIMECLPTPGD